MKPEDNWKFSSILFETVTINLEPYLPKAKKMQWEKDISHKQEQRKCAKNTPALKDILNYFR